MTAFARAVAIQPVLEWIAHFSQTRERFVVLEIYPDHVRATRCSMHVREKKITIGLQVTRRLASGADPFAAAVGACRRCRGIARAKVIACLDSRFAATVASSVTVVRSRSREPISQHDLDGAIAQATWKVFDRHRTRAAKRMAIDDLAVTLADVTIEAVAVDGHHVVSPLGFSARSMSVRCRQTFVARATAARLAPLAPALVAEAGFFETTALARATGSDPLLLSCVGDRQTAVFIADGGVVSARAPLYWGRLALASAVADACAVSSVTAAELLDRYARSLASPALLRHLSGVLTGEVERLGELLANAALPCRLSALYLTGEPALPELCYSSAVSRAFKPRVRALAPRPVALAAQLGIDAPETIALTPLAALIGFYFSTGDGTLNTVARRHARWLMG